MTKDESLDKIRNIFNQWGKDLRDSEKTYKRIDDIRESLMNARTTEEVNEIAEANIQFIDHMGMWNTVNMAKRRILAIRRECNLSFKNQLN